MNATERLKTSGTGGLGTRTSARKGRTQAERRAQTREALLSAAVEHINAVGAAAVTTQQIAASAGLTRGAVQHQFGTPEDLYLAVVTRGWEQVAAAHQSAPSIETPLEQRITGWARTLHAAYDCEAARAAIEMLVHHRNNAAFMAGQLPALQDAEGVVDRIWADSFADTALPPAELIRIRRTARSFVIGTLVRRMSDPTDTANPSEDLVRLLTALLAPTA